MHLNSSYHIRKLFNFAVESLICIKSDDKYVSAAIEKNGGWEIPTVTKVMEAMDLYPSAIFIGRCSSQKNE